MTETARYSAVALTLMRVVTALLFLEHASMKLLAFPAGIPGMSGSLPPLMMVAAVIETITGGLLLLGLFSRVAAFVASGEMAVAYFLVHLPQGIWPVLNQGEAAVMFCFIFLYISCAGPGRLALDNRHSNSAF